MSSKAQYSSRDSPFNQQNCSDPDPDPFSLTCIFREYTVSYADAEIYIKG